MLEVLLDTFYGRQLKKTFFVAFIERKENQYSLLDVCARYFAVLTLSSILQNVFVYPVDRLRTIAFTDFSKLSKNKPRAGLGYIRKVIDNEGYLKVYKGFRFSLFYTIPQNMLTVASFALLREKYEFNLFNSVFIGRMLANSVLYPLDTVLRRFQADSLLDKSKYKYNSVYTVILDISKREGWRGYYKGFLIANIHSALSIGMYILVFRNLFDSQTVLH